MFQCKGCAVLQEQVKHLQGLVDRLSDRLVAIASPQAFGAVEEAKQTFKAQNYYGNEYDQLVDYDPFGQKIVGYPDPLSTDNFLKQSPS